VARRNRGEVTIEVAAPTVTEAHLSLFNRHKFERGLAQGDEERTDATGYRFHMVDTCTLSREVRYLVNGKMVAVSVLDFGQRAASSVYHYFDPDESDRSLGVYSVLAEIELCRRLSIEWYYLGLYVADCRRLAYKAQYHPHERRIAGSWREFTAAGD
jgi:arginine-tRNA-protein transferase